MRRKQRRMMVSLYMGQLVALRREAPGEVRRFKRELMRTLMLGS